MPVFIGRHVASPLIYLFHADIMECQNGMHNCSQRCIELEGGFSCACDEGYQLEDDEVSCIGTKLYVPERVMRYRYLHQISMSVKWGLQDVSKGVSIQ